jgi:hypothetical protein
MLMTNDRSKLIVAALMFILVAALILMVGLYAKASRRSDHIESALKEKDGVIKYHENAYGRIVAEKNAAQLSTKEFQEFYAKESRRLSEQFDVKIKNVRAMISAEFAAHGSGNAGVTNHYYIDSTGAQTKSTQIRISDGYLDATIEHIDSLRNPYDYTYSDSILFAFHVKKSWVFGAEKLYGSGMLSNPNAKIMKSTAVMVDNYRDKRWSVGPSLTAYPVIDNGVRVRLTPGVSVQWALFKF